MPTDPTWSKQIIWGNYLVSGGYLDPSANAWSSNIVWGMGATLMKSGDNIVWGMTCGNSCDNVAWGVTSGANIVWQSGNGTLYAAGAR